MKKLIFSLTLMCSILAYAQKTDGVSYTIKKENKQEMQLTLPPGTVITGGNTVTINGLPVTITTVEKAAFANDTLVGKKADIYILSMYSVEDLKNQQPDMDTRNMEFRNTDKGNFIICVCNRPEGQPQKIAASTISGDYILSLTLESSADFDYKETKMLLVDILDTMVATQNGKALPKS